MEENKPTPPVSPPAVTPAPPKAKRSNFVGMFLIFLGALFLLQEIFPFWRFDRLWPLILIAIGVWLIYRQQEK